MWEYILKNRKTGQIMQVQGENLLQIAYNYRINLCDWQIIKSQFKP